MDNSDLEALTINEAAELLRVHRRTIENWMTRGVGGVKLQAVKRGRQWFITRQAILAFQQGCTPPEPVPDARTARITKERRLWLEEAKRRHGI